MSCKQTTEDATNYLEGPNTYKRRIAHYFHLLMCYRCRRFYRQMKLVIRLSQTILPAQVPSDAEVEAVLTRLKTDNKQPS
jgi:predicted anti-sigma-YlaC factor YlaD